MIEKVRNKIKKSEFKHQINWEFVLSIKNNSFQLHQVSIIVYEINSAWHFQFIDSKNLNSNISSSSKADICTPLSTSLMARDCQKGCLTSRKISPFLHCATTKNDSWWTVMDIDKIEYYNVEHA
jgi:hypothetical protein